MNVTVAQFDRILAGSVRSVYVPLSHAETWRIGESYILLRRWRVVDGKRVLGSTGQHVTIDNLADPESVWDVGQHDAIDVGFKTTDAFRTAWWWMFPRTHVARRVDFRLGDWRDQPRFLASTPSGDARGYTGSRSGALDDAECVNDEWLAKFAKVAETFREEKLLQRAQARRRANNQRH